ncbi:bifunctional riboflavin kinase/FAD synthetase [Bythopirellula goksoeyrii]|uniref:Riboflavin biosynthesis protein n=1 Tax=Bythopirellula goksoeyrii TaxID=1400387 RepID=A0A5B9Q294_9BACT|nr:bifunctional riboflavin kinase/FAD synthetase [Bythopirellula goksoeyrii]QEG33147.1 Riboflavin kinase [Bythopirellula goksoeyrii]
MPIIRDLEYFPEAARHGAVAIGNFDGVHRGHLEIVRRLIERAREVNGPAIVFTFDPHPVRLLRPEQCPPPLTWTERKAQLLAEHGVNKVVAYPTDEQLLRLSAQEFFDSIVCNLLQARAIVEGPNFYFGHNREGNVELLSQLASRAGLTLDVVPPVEIDGGLVSSSRIRELIADGKVANARGLLSAPYRIRGMVTHGAGRGAKLGFPTANLEAIDTLLPGVGVYAGRAWLNTTSYPAAIHIGPNPTFGEAALKVEIHLLDFHDVLYGQPLEVEFVDQIRNTCTFESEASLVAQLEQDVHRTREITSRELGSETS